MDISTAILKIDQFDWLRINIQITHAHEHFYQVSCLYLHVPSFCHFPLCLTYEFGSHLEISVSHFENGKKLRWLTRKYLQERFEEHNLKVSRLYPEVHDRLKKQTFPVPLIHVRTIRHFKDDVA